MKAREVLIAIWKKHDGIWEDIYKDLRDKIVIDEKELEKQLEGVDCDNFITILDKEYPRERLQQPRPPFVLVKLERETKKYIRTPLMIFEVVGETDVVYRVKARFRPYKVYSKSKSQTEVVKSANTIEELCDKFVKIRPNLPILISQTGTLWSVKKPNEEVYGAIWTKKGLMYVAKMNDEGELELI